jgi:hypothetical protein
VGPCWLFVPQLVERVSTAAPASGPLQASIRDVVRCTNLFDFFLTKPNRYARFWPLL